MIILSRIPKYQSHYSRFSNPNKVYFGADLNISRLYNDFYLPFCDERGLNPVKENRYRRIFSESYNIGFKFPKSDTCAICDELHIVINNEDTELAAKARAESEKELHLRYADSLRQKLTEYTQTAKNIPDDVHLITVDLQQTLPTPKLTVGHAFYVENYGYIMLAYITVPLRLLICSCGMSLLPEEEAQR